MINQIKTYEDAEKIYKELYGPLPKLNFQKHTSKLTMASAEAFTKLSIIYRVLNQNWEPDWANFEQYKWRPWFDWSNTNSPFSFASPTINWSTVSPGNPYLCFENKKSATYAGQTFPSLYKNLLYGTIHIPKAQKNDQIHVILQHNKNKAQHGPKIRFIYE